MAGVPRSTPEELAALVEVEPGALTALLGRRYPAADPGALGELCDAVLALRARARSLTPAPTREELGLGLLALLALHEGRVR